MCQTWAISEKVEIPTNTYIKEKSLKKETYLQKTEKGKNH